VLLVDNGNEFFQVLARGIDLGFDLFFERHVPLIGDDRYAQRLVYVIDVVQFRLLILDEFIRQSLEKSPGSSCS
jgi:hypothetical protein